MKYEYFISFIKMDSNSSSIGIGNVNIEIRGKIDDIETIREVEEYIQELLKTNKKITIINYQLLKKIGKENK